MYVSRNAGQAIVKYFGPLIIKNLEAHNSPDVVCRYVRLQSAVLNGIASTACMVCSRVCMLAHAAMLLLTSRTYRTRTRTRLRTHRSINLCHNPLCALKPKAIPTIGLEAAANLIRTETIQAGLLHKDVRLQSVCNYDYC